MRLDFVRPVLGVGGLPVMVMNSVMVVVTPSVDSWAGKPGALIDPDTKAIVVVGTGGWGKGFSVDDVGRVSEAGAASVTEEPNGAGPPANPDMDGVVLTAGGEAVLLTVVDTVLLVIVALFGDVALSPSISCAFSAVSQPISTPVPDPVFGRA